MRVHLDYFALTGVVFSTFVSWDFLSTLSYWSKKFFNYLAFSIATAILSPIFIYLFIVQDMIRGQGGYPRIPNVWLGKFMYRLNFPKWFTINWNKNNTIGTLISYLYYLIRCIPLKPSFYLEVLGNIYREPYNLIVYFKKIFYGVKNILSLVPIPFITYNRTNTLPHEVYDGNSRILFHQSLYFSILWNLAWTAIVYSTNPIYTWYFAAVNGMGWLTLTIHILVFVASIILTTVFVPDLYFSNENMDIENIRTRDVMLLVLRIYLYVFGYIMANFIIYYVFFSK